MSYAIEDSENRPGPRPRLCPEEHRSHPYESPAPRDVGAAGSAIGSTVVASRYR